MSMLKYNSTSSDEFFKVNIVIKNIYKGIDINATIDVKEDLMEIGVNLICIIEKWKIFKKIKFQAQVAIHSQNPIDKNRFIQLVNMTGNVCDLLASRSKNFLIGDTLNDIEKVTNMKLRCPLKKVSNLNSYVVFEWPLNIKRDSLPYFRRS